MIKLTLTILLACYLAGCASVGQSKSENIPAWMKENYQLVKEGTLKRSDFYKQLFRKLSSNSETRHQTNMLTSTNMMIDASLQYESGQMNIEQYNAAKREALIVFNKKVPEVNTRSSSSNLDYLLIDPPQVNCNSYSVGTNTYTNCR